MVRFLEPPLVVLFLLFLFVLASRFNVSPAISSVTAISRDQVACTLCSSCDNPCQPILSPPPPLPLPPPEPNCPPPPMPPPPPESNCPPLPRPLPPPESNSPPLPLPPPRPIGINFPEWPPPNPMMPYFPLYHYNPPASADIYSSAGMMAKRSTLSAIFPLPLILSSFIV
ncbi:leucine-rich repeat extensin-like protein 3 [Diospyros lotus]|uniref:leucine-rich repeat extensin-like protein 3 n=1 Tax=Diospyros lotus TaxID=55363 RepID=UPI00225783A4|nr:leucine-rich repeat extensin-like protein 3 [Diospyros lotus]